MESVPGEYLTPPLALVALMGCEDLHPQIMEHFKLAKPPINCLGVANPLHCDKLFSPKKKGTNAAARDHGILKRGWFTKHRQRTPAVGVLLLKWQDMTDTSASALFESMALVRNAVQAACAKLVVVVHMPPDKLVRLSEEQTTMLLAATGVDSKYVVVVVSCLSVLHTTVHEAATVHFLEAAARALGVLSQGKPPAVVCAKQHIKAGAYAEFRVDWPEALKHYEAAYKQLRRAAAAVEDSTQCPLQRYMEVLSVAEVMSVKITTLLLHLRRTAEAMQYIVSHITMFATPPLTLPASVASAHKSWLARQCHIVGDRLTRFAEGGGQGVSMSPAYLYLQAALHAVEARKLQQAATQQGNNTGLQQGNNSLQQPPDVSHQSPGVSQQQHGLPHIQPGEWLGQVVVVVEDAVDGAPRDGGALETATITTTEATTTAGTTAAEETDAPAAATRPQDVATQPHNQQQQPPDTVYVAYTAVNTTVKAASEYVLLLLTRAHEVYKGSSRKRTRALSYVAALMGTEQALTGDIMGGWALLNAVAGAHQREGWTLLLGHTLQHMLTIAQQASWSHATVCLSLHLAALPQVLDVDQRRALTRDAWSTLTAASSRKGGDGGGGDIGGNSGGMGASAHSGPLSAAAATDDPWAPVPGSSSVLVISPTHAGLCCVLPMAVGFAPMAAHDTQLLMGITIYNALPLPLTIDTMHITIDDARGHRTIPIPLTAPTHPPPTPPTTAPTTTTTAAYAWADGWHGVLTPAQWHRVYVYVPLQCPGRLAVQAVSLGVGGVIVLQWEVASFASLPSCTWPLTGGPPPTPLPPPGFPYHPAIQLGHTVVEGPLRHRPPQLDVDGLAVALQGETLPIALVVRAPDPLHRCQLLLQARYTEGGPSARVGAGGPGVVVESSGDAVTVTVACIEGKEEEKEGVLTVPLTLTMPVEGELVVSAALSYHTSEEGGSEYRTTLRRDIQVQPPLSCTTTMATIHGTTAMLEAPEDDDDDDIQKHGQEDSQGGVRSGSSSQVSSPRGPPPGKSGDPFPEEGGGVGSTGGGGGGRPLVIPLGVECVLSAHVQVAAPCQMHIQEVVFEPATPPSTTATPDTPTTTPRPVPPPPAAVTTLGPPIGAPAAGRSLLLGRGDVCSVLFPIRCTEQGVGQSLGVLRVKWRRGGVTGVGRGKEEKEGAVWSETLKPSQPYPVAEVVLPLPLVTIAPPRLTLHLQAPPSVTSGTPFDLVIRAVNHTPVAQAIAFSVGDSHGFLMSGGRTFTMQCLPDTEQLAMWRMVAYAAGALKLPELTATVARYSRKVVLTGGQGVFVFPAAPVGVEGGRDVRAEAAAVVL